MFGADNARGKPSASHAADSADAHNTAPSSALQPDVLPARAATTTQKLVEQLELELHYAVILALSKLGSTSPGGMGQCSPRQIVLTELAVQLAAVVSRAFAAPFTHLHVDYLGMLQLKTGVAACRASTTAASSTRPSPDAAGETSACNDLSSAAHVQANGPSMQQQLNCRREQRWEGLQLDEVQTRLHTAVRAAMHRLRAASVPGGGSYDSLQAALCTALAEELAEPLSQVSDDTRSKFAQVRFVKSQTVEAAELASMLHDAAAVGSSAQAVGAASAQSAGVPATMGTDAVSAGRLCCVLGSPRQRAQSARIASFAALPVLVLMLAWWASTGFQVFPPQTRLCCLGSMALVTAGLWAGAFGVCCVLTAAHAAA